MNKESELIDKIIDGYNDLSMSLTILQQIRKNKGRKTSKQIAEEIGVDNRIISIIFNPNMQAVNTVLLAMKQEAKGDQPPY